MCVATCISVAEVFVSVSAVIYVDHNYFIDGHLRERLVDEMDYFLIPESAWNKLASWYGLSPSSKVISRYFGENSCMH